MPAFVVVRVWVATFYIHAATAAIGYLVVDEEFGPIALVQVEEDVKVHKFNPLQVKCWNKNTNAENVPTLKMSVVGTITTSRFKSVPV